jgi:hypothetical protein
MNLPENYQPLFIGHFHDGQQWQYLPMSSREVRRGMRVILQLLDSFRFPARSSALVIAGHDEWALTMPLETALTTNKMILFNADASPFEAPRIEAFIRRFDPPMVFGLTAEVLQGLESVGHDAGTLFNGRVVWTADAAAWHRLKVETDARVFRMMMIGPALAMECSQGCGLHIDAEEWTLDREGGQIVVTHRLGRQPALVRQKTGISGSIDNGVCRCGSASPRVIPED